MRHQTRVGIAATVLLASTLTIVASDGARPIGYGQTITQPGKYVVTKDLSGNEGPVLEIMAPGVEIDLNGFSITQMNPVYSVIEIDTATPGPVTLRNGTLAGGLNGVADLSVDADLTLRDLDVAGFLGAGVHAPSFEKVDASDIRTDGGQLGFDLSAPTATTNSVRLRDVRVMTVTDTAVRVTELANLEASGVVVINAVRGLDLQGIAAPFVGSQALIGHSNIHADFGVSCTNTGCNIYESAITSCTFGILYSAGPGSMISHTTVNGSGVDGCYGDPGFEDSLVQIVNSPGVNIHGVTVTGPGGGDPNASGIEITDSDVVTILEVESSYNGKDGIEISGADHVLIEHSVTSKNGRHGVATQGDATVVQDCDSSGNGQDGMHFGTMGIHVYRNNTMLLNQAGIGGIGMNDAIDGGGNIEMNR